MDRSWVVDDEWINLSAWTGRAANTLPTWLREPGDYLAHVSSLMATIGDPACHPNSGGIAGGHIARSYGVEEQQFRRHIAPNLPYLRRLGDIFVTNVESARADGARYRLEVNAQKRANLKQYSSRSGLTDPSSNYL